MRRWPWLLVAVIATAPVHVWTLRRLADGSEAPWGLLALVTLVALVARQRGRPDPAMSSEGSPFLAPGLLLLVYAFSYGAVLPLIRGAVAMIAISLLLCRLYLRRGFELGVTGLCLLTLPVSASLQFYLGYPLRAVVAQIAAALLRVSGLSVAAQGVGLSWGSQLVVVDAPCAGIKMLWVGAFVTSALLATLQLSLGRGLLAATAALTFIVVGNALRAAALFYPEAGLIVLPDLGHEIAGLAVFAAITAGIAALCLRLRPSELRPSELRPSKKGTPPCATPAT